MFTLRTSTAIYLSAIALAGCGVHSAEPLGPQEAMFADDHLVGVWRLRTSDQQPAAVYRHIGRDSSNPRQLNCLTVHRSGSGGVRPARIASLSTTVIGESKIANINYETDNDLENFTFAKYTIEENQLRLYLMDPNVIARAVRAGELAGEVKSYRFVRLSADETDLVNYVASADHEDLFGPTTQLIFERIDPQLAVSDR